MPLLLNIPDRAAAPPAACRSAATNRACVRPVGLGMHAVTRY